MRFVVATAGGDRATYNCTVVLFASVGFGGLAGCALGRFIGVFIAQLPFTGEHSPTQNSVS